MILGCQDGNVKCSFAHQDLVLGEADLGTAERDVHATVAGHQLARGLGSAVHRTGHVQFLSIGRLTDLHGAHGDGALRKTINKIVSHRGADKKKALIK